MPTSEDGRLSAVNGIELADGSTLSSEQLGASVGGIEDIRTVDTTDSPYPLTTDNSVVLVDAAAGAVAVALPAASTVAGRVFNIKRLDGTVNTVTVDPDGAELIDGATTAALTIQYESVTLVSDGTGWSIL